MKRRIEAVTAVVAGVIAMACDQPQPFAPTLTGLLFAAATTTDITATAGPLLVTVPGKMWVSDGILHIRNQTQSGPVSGDITGSVTLTGRLDVTTATMTGTASGKFTITAAGGTWEGSFEGKFDNGVFNDRVVAQGTGAFAGLILRGTISQTAPSNIYHLTATILNPGGN